MKIAVQFFGQLKDITRTEQTEMQLHAGATVHDALSRAYESYPGLARWDQLIRVGIGVEYAERKTPLQDGDTIAIMPPVQGG